VSSLPRGFYLFFPFTPPLSSCFFVSSENDRRRVLSPLGFYLGLTSLALPDAVLWDPPSLFFWRVQYFLLLPGGEAGEAC